MMNPSNAKLSFVVFRNFGVIPAVMMLAVVLCFATFSSAAIGAKWTNTGSMGTARGSHTATLLSNGKVLVAGGYNGATYISSAELFDPATGTWSATGSMAVARSFHTATLLANGEVLAAGGFSSGDASDLMSAELYNPDTGTWSATGSLAVARANHTATLLQNGKVLAAGGDLRGPRWRARNCIIPTQAHGPPPVRWRPREHDTQARCFKVANS